MAAAISFALFAFLFEVVCTVLAVYVHARARALALIPLAFVFILEVVACGDCARAP